MEIVLPDGTPALTSDLFIKEYTSLFNKNDAKKAMKFIEKFRQAVDEADLKSAMQGKCLNLLKPEGEGVFSFFPEGHHNGTNSRVCGYIRDGKFVYTGSALHGPQYSALIAETKRQAKIYSKLPLPTPEIAELSSQTANIIHQQTDVNEVFKNNEHIRQKCYNLHGEYHNAKSPDDLEALKELCLDPETGFLPNTVEGKETILKYAETDPQFKKFLEDVYRESESIKVKKLGSPVSKLVQSSWQDIDANDSSKGIQKIVKNKTEARQIMAVYQKAGIKCTYNEQTKSLQVTDSQSVAKIRELEARGTATDVDNIHSINGNGRKPRIPGQKVKKGKPKGGSVQGAKVLNKLR